MTIIRKKKKRILLFPHDYSLQALSVHLTSVNQYKVSKVCNDLY